MLFIAAYCDLIKDTEIYISIYSVTLNPLPKMSQLEDVRSILRKQDERISRLERLVNPPAEAANFLDDAPRPVEPVVTLTPPTDPDAPMTVTVTGETLPPPPIITGEQNPEGGMGVVVGGNGQQPSVSEEGTNEGETKDAPN